MNSNSKSYYNDKCHNDKCDPCRRRPENPEVAAIVKCGTSGTATIPVATVAGTTFTPASLALNTSSLCNPCVKLEFTSNIVAAAFTGSISFQVFKQCDNQFTPVPVGPAFTYARLVDVFTASDTFTFYICDCDSCNKDCCSYTVVATVTSAATVGVLNINNASLNAVAASQTKTCC